MTTGDEYLRDLEGKYDDYTVYDRDASKIGKVDELFLGENDREEYIGVNTGLFGLSGTTLIPLEIVNVDENEKALRVDESKDRIKDAPSYSNEDDIDSEYEDKVRQHFGLGSSGGGGTYGRYSNDETNGQEAGRGESDEGRRDEDSGGSGDENPSASGALQTDQEGSSNKVEPGDGESSAPGYRDSESGGRGEGMGLTNKRRRVRRRSLREENEELFEEEETSGRPE